MKILKSLLNRMQMSHFTVVRINASGFFFKGHRLMILEYLKEKKIHSFKRKLFALQISTKT